MSTVVKVGKVPGRIVEVALNGGRSVADALEIAEITGTEGYEIRVNGNTANAGTELSDGDTVLLSQQIKGN
jgi:sulfur carrier protein ThiS